MHTVLNKIFLCLAVALVLIDLTWVTALHTAVDGRNYALLLALVLPMTAGAIFYDHFRVEPALSAILAGASFLLVFSASCSLLSYMLVTIAGTRSP